MTTPAITAVICTRNRARFLEKCLLSVMSQSLPRDRYEILVVDNGSTDNTAAVAAGYADGGFIRVVHEPVAGLSRARNTAWRNARSDLVGYIDDDATAVEGWVGSALEAFAMRDPAPAWVGGPIDLEWETAAPGWINEELSVPLGKVDWGEKPHVLAPGERLGGGNSFYRRERLEAWGGFDERLGRGSSGLLSGEETELQRRVEAAGGVIYYHPGVRIRHFVAVERTKPVWFYRRYFWGGYSDYIMGRAIAQKIGTDARRAGAVAEAQGRAGRVWRNVRNAAGLCRAERDVVYGRVYVSYVAGRLSALFKHGVLRRPLPNVG